MKVKVFYFDTDDMIKVFNKNVKDGRVKIGKAEFIVDNIKEPKLIETNHWLFGRFYRRTMRFYYLYHGVSNALSYDVETESFKNTMSPEVQKKIAEQGVVKQLLALKGKDKLDIVMWLAIGGMMGLLLGIILAPQLGLI